MGKKAHSTLRKLLLLRILCSTLLVLLLVSCGKDDAIDVVTDDPQEQPEEKPVDPEDPKENPGDNTGDDPQQGEDPVTDKKTFPREDLAWQKVEHFPTIRITTDGGAGIYSKEEYVTADIRVEDPDKMYSDSTLYTGRMRIRGRGNTTWDMPKKPYRIKLDEHTKLFGMKGNKDWVLLANYSDKSLLRNVVAMEISRLCALPWTPRMRTVELYLNGSYQGSYVLCQHKEVAKEKVDINVEAGDLYLEVDTTQDELECFESERWLIPFMFKDPEQPTAQQVADFKAYIRSVEDALYANPGGDYASLIDVDSFIGNYIVQEIAKNVDGNFRKSNFLTKTVGGKLTVAHVWDFDIALGNCNYIDSQHQNGVTNGPEGWLIKIMGRKKKTDSWYPRLFLDPPFVEALVAKWDAIKPGLDEIPAMIDHYVELNRASYDHNFQTWHILGTYVWPNVETPSTYDGEIDYLKDFYTRRIAWLDAELHKL